jgi:small subunit ribosomal protein S2
MLSLANLYQLGAHRGNSKSKINPKLKNRVIMNSSDVCTIDLVSTIDSITKVKELFSKLGRSKKQILVIGTSNHINNKVVDIAKTFNNSEMPYVNVRWLGGTLTNWLTVKKSLKVLEKNESIKSDEKFFSTLARNEQLSISRQIVKMGKFFDGLKSLKTNRPGAVLVLDAANNDIAIKEAELIGCPVVAITNTYITYLPKKLEYTILMNNNSISALDFVVKELVDSYNQGLVAAQEVKTETETKPKTDAKVEFKAI